MGGLAIPPLPPPLLVRPPPPFPLQAPLRKPSRQPSCPSGNPALQPLIPEECSYPWGLGCFHPHAFTTLFDSFLIWSSQASHLMKKKRACLVSAVPPAPVRRDLPHPAAEVGPGGCMPREKLVVPAREGLWLMSELLSEHFPLWRLVAAGAADVVGDPDACTVGLLLGCHLRPVVQAGLPHVCSVDSIL